LPREILALTFTDNAAQEMQARVDLLVPYGQADAAIHTFHAFGDRLLRENAFELGLASNLRLLTRNELIVFLREHVFELGLSRYMPLGDPTRFLGALVDMFGRAKDEDLSVADLALHAAQLQSRAEAETGSTVELADLAGARSELAGAFEIYTQLMAAGGYIDHADQVAMTLRLLRTRAAVRASIAHRFRYILVDELQDTNRSQLELVLALAGANANVMAVGDPHQGIYGFRGARSGNVDRFRAAFSETKSICLRRNYRSLAPIVEAAERMVAANGHTQRGQGTQVATRRARSGVIGHVVFATPEAEADGVAENIAIQIRKGAKPSDFAVLVRSNSEIGEFERSLRVRGIDVDTGSVARLLDVPAVRSLVAYLRVVTDQANSLETYVLAAAEPYRLDGQLLGRLLSSSRRRNRTLVDALTEVGGTRDPAIPADVQQRITQLLRQLRTGVEMSAEHTSGEVLYDYLHRSGMLARFAISHDPAVEADARSVARFCELVRSRAALLVEDRVPFLVRALELDRDITQEEADRAERDAIRVITVHRAKGLEFARVFVSGLVDGKFPVRSRPPALALPDELMEEMDDGRSLAEERRLFYVALTRARDSVTLTSHEYGPHGRGRRRPSIFIAEAIDAPSAVAPLQTVTSPVESIAHALVEPAVSADEPALDRSLTLSFSQIDEFLTCPERYRLRYDIGIPTPAHHALSYGTAIHQAIASFHTAQARGVTMSDEELIAELRRAWQPDGFLSREHEDARFAAGSDALRRFRIQQLASGAQAPEAIERPFTFRLGRDEIRGRIDRVNESDAGTIITDYKSSDVRDQKRADTKARDSLQLQVYALAHEAQTGRAPASVQLHFVESGVVGRAQPTRERLDKAREKLLTTADQIRARKFEPKPSAVACGYCPFRTICSASAA
jgi:DNA helicase-2/ATP-dependent DNA helicase PcrA